MAEDTIEVAVEPDPRRGWLTVMLEVDSIVLLRMAITFLPQSRIGTEAATFLRPFGLLTPQGADRFRLLKLTLGAVRLPDLEVGVSAVLRTASVDGFFGTDFLEGFAEIRYRPADRRLDLRRQ